MGDINYSQKGGLWHCFTHINLQRLFIQQNWGWTISNNQHGDSVEYSHRKPEVLTYFTEQFEDMGPASGL